MAAVAALFAGRFALFTSVRPFLETVTRVGPSVLSLFHLLIGAAGLVGSVLIGSVLRTRLQAGLLVPPLAMAALAVGLIALGAWPVFTAVLLGLWRLISTPSPTAWWIWLSRTLPDDAEAGGGLMVAAIQLAIPWAPRLADGWSMGVAARPPLAPPPPFCASPPFSPS
jgi:predicted MFS family arabinose efflux permease